MTVKRIPQMTQKQIDRFWGYVDKSKECWEWQACLNRQRRNYGIYGINGRNYQAHRISYSLSHGVDPADLQVCHKCDNPRCVNPDHLFLGTMADNMHDRDRKGRHIPPTGSRNGQTNLTEPMVLDIRERFKQGETQTAIGKSLGIDNSTVGYIVRRVTWQHI